MNFCRSLAEFEKNDGLAMAKGVKIQTKNHKWFTYDVFRKRIVPMAGMQRELVKKQAFQHLPVYKYKRDKSKVWITII